MDSSGFIKPTAKWNKNKRKLRATPSGEDDDFEAIADIDKNTKPPGPTNAQELEDWPMMQLLSVDSKPGLQLAQRFMTLLKYGTLNTTDYSGADCPREMDYQLSLAMAKKYGLPEPPRFSFVRACDNDHLPQKVLLQAAKKLDKCRTCVSPDILSVLDKDTRKFLDEMEPPLEMRTSDKEADRVHASKMYSQMLDWLMANRARIIPEDASFPCMVHEQQCKLEPSGREIQMDDDDRVLKLNWAGTTCKGWSTVGDSGGFCDASEKIHAVFVTQRARMAELNKEDGFFGECTSKYPVDIKLGVPLEPWMHVVWIKVDAAKLGFPSKRPRCLSFGANRNRRWWV
jgi:hypothetical protein